MTRYPGSSCQPHTRSASAAQVGSLFLSYDTTVADPVVTLTVYDVLACCSVSAVTNRFQIRIHNIGGGTMLNRRVELRQESPLSLR